MTWNGPIETGLSQSMINMWQEDPYSSYLYFIKGLKEPETLSPELIWGDAYHVGLEHLIQNHTDNVPYNFELAAEQAVRRLKPPYPKTFPFSIPEMLKLYPLNKIEDCNFDTEIIFDTAKGISTKQGLVPCHPLSDILKPFRLRGKMDGWNGHKPHFNSLLEHKCKKSIDQAQTKAEIPLDLQCMLYCLVSGARKIYYDLILIPDLQFMMPQPKVRESNGEFIQRLFYKHNGNGYPIVNFRNKYIQQVTVTLTDDQVIEYTKSTILPLLHRINNWYEEVTSPNFHPEKWSERHYRTPIRHFTSRNTEKFKGPYWKYLTGEIDEDDLVPVKYFSELNE